MRPRPQWRKPYRTYPKGGGPGVHAAFVAKRTAFGDFSPGSGRRQCVSIAKHTGERCRRDAVQGANQCRTHKGISPALYKLRQERGPHVQRLDTGATARRALCAIAFDAAPDGFSGEAPNATARGRLYEAFRNRAYAPDVYRLYLCQTKNGN
jgi:hypothetical protein